MLQRSDDQLVLINRQVFILLVIETILHIVSHLEISQCFLSTNRVSVINRLRPNFPLKMSINWAFKTLCKVKVSKMYLFKVKDTF